MWAKERGEIANKKALTTWGVREKSKVLKRPVFGWELEVKLRIREIWIQ